MLTRLQSLNVFRLMPLLVLTHLLRLDVFWFTSLLVSARYIIMGAWFPLSHLFMMGILVLMIY